MPHMQLQPDSGLAFCSGAEKQDAADKSDDTDTKVEDIKPKMINGVNADRAAANGLDVRPVKQEPKRHGMLDAPKPTIPNGVQLPEGEEDWLSLWDLTDSQIEARLLRAKRKAAAQRNRAASSPATFAATGQRRAGRLRAPREAWLRSRCRSRRDRPH